MSPETKLIGIPRNNPYITPLNKCRYDCCITLPKDMPIREDVEHMVLDHNKYAVYEFEKPLDYGKRKLLIECYSELYSYWLPYSGYRYTGNPVEFVEIQSKQNTLGIECGITGIAIPIEPK